ncbi:MAG: hypothetical protein R3Y05_02520 [bacterium]
MIHKILQEENNSIKELLLLRCKYLKPNQKPNQNLYIAISEYNSDLGSITDDPYELTKYEGFEDEYFFYITSPIKVLFLNETITKTISNEIAEQILIILTLQLSDTELEEHLSALGISEKEYIDLINNKIDKVTTNNKVYKKQTLLDSFNINLSEYKQEHLIQEVELEDIIDE